MLPIAAVGADGDPSVVGDVLPVLVAARAEAHAGSRARHHPRSTLGTRVGHLVDAPVQRVDRVQRAVRGERDVRVAWAPRQPPRRWACMGCIDGARRRRRRLCRLRPALRSRDRSEAHPNGERDCDGHPLACHVRLRRLGQEPELRRSTAHRRSPLRAPDRFGRRRDDDAEDLLRSPYERVTTKKNGSARCSILLPGRGGAMRASDPHIGSDLLGYEIEEVIGRGGMGVVYRARDRALERNVALKLIAPEYAGFTGFRGRFLAESRLAASLEHPNVVPIYGGGGSGRPPLYRDAVHRGPRSQGDPARRCSRRPSGRSRSVVRSQARSTPRTSRVSSTATSSPRTS